MRTALVLGSVAGLIAGFAIGCQQDSIVTRSVGARCNSSTECDDRCLLEGEGFPAGFCTLSCDNSGDCTARTACAELEGGVCLFECDEPLDCKFLGAGWTCVEVEVHSQPGSMVKVCRGS